jgi:hypothetical protein
VPELPVTLLVDEESDFCGMLDEPLAAELSGFVDGVLTPDAGAAVLPEALEPVVAEPEALVPPAAELVVSLSDLVVELAVPPALDWRDLSALADLSFFCFLALLFFAGFFSVSAEAPAPAFMPGPVLEPVEEPPAAEVEPLAVLLSVELPVCPPVVALVSALVEP